MQNRLSADLEARQRKQDQQIHAFLDLHKRAVSNENEEPDYGSGSMLVRANSLMADTQVFLDCASPTRAMRKGRLTDYNAKFVNKDTWKKGNFCNICKREVDVAGTNRHHCRMCANTVCGKCSCRKINNKRVCDLCFYRKEITEQDTKFHRSLSQKQEIWQEKSLQVENLKAELVNWREKYCQFEDQIEKEQHIQARAIENQTKVKFSFLNKLEKAKETQARLTSGIERNKSLIGEKESRLRSLQMKIISLKTEIAQKSQKQKELVVEFDELLEKHTRLNEITESGTSMSSRTSAISKNYSLVLDENDGKYYLSRKPVQI